MKNVTLRQLRVFASAARLLNFGKAAAELHLTPPAVSMQIRELEQQVGLPLFERHGKAVSLTVTGEYFVVYARRVLATLRDAEDALARFRGLESGRLTLGLVSTAKYFVPRLLARFRDEHPHIEVRLTIGNREQLVAQLQGKELDLAIMGRPPRDLATRAEPFAAHPLGVVCAADHPLLRGEQVPARSLAQHPLIIRESGSGTRRAMEDYLREHHVLPRIEMELPSNETIKQTVMAGMGIGFLSLHTVGMELRHGLIGAPDVEGLPLVRSWQVVHLSSKTLSPSAEAFRYFVLENGEAFMAREFGDLPPLAQALNAPPAPPAAPAARFPRAARADRD